MMKYDWISMNNSWINIDPFCSFVLPRFRSQYDRNANLFFLSNWLCNGWSLHMFTHLPVKLCLPATNCTLHVRSFPWSFLVWLNRVILYHGYAWLCMGYGFHKRNHLQMASIQVNDLFILPWWLIWVKNDELFMIVNYCFYCHQRILINATMGN